MMNEGDKELRDLSKEIDENLLEFRATVGRFVAVAVFALSLGAALGWAVFQFVSWAL